MINYIKNCETCLQFLRFITIGVINTLLNYIVYLFMLEIVDIYYLFAGISGFIVGAISAFFLNRAWSFKNNICIKAGLSLYMVVQIFCLFIHVLIQYGVTEIFVLRAEYSQFPSIVVTTFINFFLIRKFVFVKK